MKHGETTKAAEVAFIVLSGGRLLDVRFVSEDTAVFVYECPDEVSISNYYASPFVDFIKARNAVFDRLNLAKARHLSMRITDRRERE